jgi:hypothetical protein
MKKDTDLDPLREREDFVEEEVTTPKRCGSLVLRG